MPQTHVELTQNYLPACIRFFQSVTCVSVGVAKGRGMMNCPTCRRSLAVPSGGFPICVLAEHLRDQVENAAKPSINAVKPSKYATIGHTIYLYKELIDHARFF